MLISVALALCKKCPTQGKDGCRFADFQSGKREEYKHPLPDCIIQLASGKTVKITKTKKVQGEQPKSLQITLLDVKPERTVDVPWVWDRLDSKIIDAILNKYNVNGIVRITEDNKGTVQYRLKRMEKEGLIIGYEERIAGLKKLFNLTPKGRKVLNRPEPPSKSQATVNPSPASQSSPYPFSSHANAMIFPILSGEPPTTGRPYKMTNWTGHTFDSTDGSHSIRTTPKSVVVYVNIDLGNHSVINLIIKFSELAKSFAGKFAEKHKLKLGEPEAYRDPHWLVKNNALAQIVTELGNFTTDSGMTFDKSRSSGDFEMKTPQALGFESLINDVPRAVEHIAARIDRIDHNSRTTTERAASIETGIGNVAKGLNELPIFMATLQENHELKTQIRDYQTQIFEIRTELTTLKNQMSEMGVGVGAEKRTPPTDAKWRHEHGYA